MNVYFKTKKVYVPKRGGTTQKSLKNNDLLQIKLC